MTKTVQPLAAPQRYGTAFHLAPPYADLWEIPVQQFTPTPTPYSTAVLSGVQLEQLLRLAQDDAYLQWQLAQRAILPGRLLRIAAGTKVAIGPQKITTKKYVSELLWVVIEAGAELEFQEIVAHEQLGIRRLIVEQAAESRFTYWGLRTNNSFFNEQLQVLLQGIGAQAAVQHLVVGGEQEQSDIAVKVQHLAPHTQADVKVRAAVSDRAVAVYRGLLKVGPQARGTRGYQQGKALMLSRRAVADILPELEIATNDVRCSHGVTTTHIDEASLFYLRSRGLSPLQAKQLAITGFFHQGLALPSSIAKNLEKALP